MADLPMAQIPNFQLPGPQNIPQPGGPFGQLAQGFATGTTAGLQAQQLHQEQQKIQIEKNMKMLETGSDMMLSGGPQVQQTGMSLIQKAYPFLTGQPLPQGLPLDKDAAKDLGYFMDQHRKWQQTGGKEGLSAQDAVTGATQAMSQYAIKYQQQQMGLLEKTPMYKEGMANQVGGQVNGQPAVKNEFSGEVSTPGGQSMSGAQGSFIDAGQAATLKNENTMSLNRTFLESTKDQQQQLPDLVDFTTSMAPRLPPNATPQDKADLVVHQKIGLLKYMQMNVPASRRPPNLQAMDNISKEDLVSAHAEQAWKQLFQTGAPLTEDQQSAILKNGVSTGLSAEKTLSDTESSWANRAQQNQVDPMKALQNLRPSSIPSTSKFFPNQGATALTAHVGQIVMSPTGPKVFRGGNRADPNNWTPVGNK